MKILSERTIHEHYRRCFKKKCALNMDPINARAYTAAELRLALDIFRLKGELRLADYQGMLWVFRSEDVEAVKIWRESSDNMVGYPEYIECVNILEGGQT